MSDEFLEKLLAEDNSWAEEDIVLGPLLPEIEKISDQGILLFVRAVLLKAPSHFWVDPSSFSGKHHPPDERGEGGGVLHTKRVVRIALYMAEAQERSTYEKDILIAACLLHDLTKGVRNSSDDPVQYDVMHPYTVDFFVEQVRRHDNKHGTEMGSSSLMIDDDSLLKILRLIRCHMGIWSMIPETIPLTTMEWVVHLADLLASKMHYIVDGEEIQDWRWNQPEE